MKTIKTEKKTIATRTGIKEVFFKLLQDGENFFIDMEPKKDYGFGLHEIPKDKNPEPAFKRYIYKKINRFKFK